MFHSAERKIHVPVCTNNACHQRKTNQGNTWRRTALTTVSFRKSLQIDRNHSGKKNPIIYIHLPGNWENEVGKQKPNKIKTINNTTNNNTTAMQNKLDFGGIGFNVLLAKASLKCTIFVRSNWNTSLLYYLIYILCHRLHGQPEVIFNRPKDLQALICCTSIYALFLRENDGVSHVF